jgi:hypothetical protein
MVGTVEKHDSLDVHDLKRMGVFTERTVAFQPFRWPWLAGLVVNRWTVKIRFPHCDQYQTILVVWSRCHLGGWRPWLQCPYCKRRAGKLYNLGASCACRQCCNLRYASQRRGAKSRRYLQALKLRLRLDGVASISEPFPDRPRGMHKRTYLRLRHRAERLERDLHRSRFALRTTDYSVLVPK